MQPHMQGTIPYEAQRQMASAVVITEAMADRAIEITATQAKPRERYPFRKGDFVVYPAHGVGRIERVGHEVIAGHRLDLIHISFAENRMTLRVPVAKARAAGLRRLASREACAEAMAVLGGRPRASRIMWAKRAQEYQAKINSGDLRALAEAVRDLRAGPDGTGASSSQRYLFEVAEDRLATEVAAICRIDKAAAVEQMNAAALRGRSSREAAVADTVAAAGEPVAPAKT